MAPVKSPEPTMPIRTAVVEDEPELRKMIVSLLQEDPDYNVVAEFAEGAPAVAVIPRLAADIALVDIGLPDMSGIDVIRALKARCPTCNVLVITTFGDEKTVTAALESGADGYLLKGTPREELKRDIRSLQDGGSTRTTSPTCGRISPIPIAATACTSIQTAC